MKIIIILAILTVWSLINFSNSTYEHCISDPNVIKGLRIDAVKQLMISKFNTSICDPPSMNNQIRAQMKEEYDLAKEFIDRREISIEEKCPDLPLYPQRITKEKLSNRKKGTCSKTEYYVPIISIKKGKYQKAELQIIRNKHEDDVPPVMLKVEQLRCNIDNYLDLKFLNYGFLADQITKMVLRETFNNDKFIDVTDYYTLHEDNVEFCWFKITVEESACLSTYVSQVYFLTVYNDERESLTQRRRRDTRDAIRFCEDGAELCCLNRLKLIFSEVGLNNIIAPDFIDINYCSGNCPILYSSNNNSPVLNRFFVSMLNPRGSSSPCCVPTKFHSEIVQSFIGGIPITRTLDNVVVTQCECR